jgi:hypothetical protein
MNLLQHSGEFMTQIRPLAICVFSQNGKILVCEGYDATTSDTFYRPLGGGIEFGEHLYLRQDSRS